MQKTWMKCKFRIINFLVIKFNPCYYHIYQRVVVKWRSGKVCNAGIHPPSKFGKICTERKSGECKNRFKADLSSFLGSFTAQIFCSFKTGLRGGGGRRGYRGCSGRSGGRGWWGRRGKFFITSELNLMPSNFCFDLAQNFDNVRKLSPPPPPPKKKFK